MQQQVSRMEIEIAHRLSLSEHNDMHNLLVQLYGVCDLATALGVHRNYITGCINAGVFMPTHTHGERRYFSKERFDAIVEQYKGRLRDRR
jgi:hypothetical protein